jgi:hypothetical protein
MFSSTWFELREPDMTVLGSGRSAPPPFPTELLGPFWSEWVREQAESRTCPTDYVAAGLLASAGSLIGNARRASPHGRWQEPTHLWVAVVGDPSSGKTQGLKAVLDVLREIDRDLQAERKRRRAVHKVQVDRAAVIKAAWREEAKKAVKEGLAMPDCPPEAEPPPFQDVARVLISDATIEKVARIVATSPKGVLQERDELAGWFESFTRYSGGSDRPFWLEAYNGGRYSVDRMSEPDGVIVDRLSVGIVGGLQPDRLELITRDGDDGLPCRFLYVWPDPMQDFRIKSGAGQDEGAIAALYRLHDLVQSNGALTPTPVRLDEPALTHLEVFGQKMRLLASTASGPIAGVYGKAAGSALRLAATLTYLMWSVEPGTTEPSSITEQVMKSAIDLMEAYFLPQARRVFGQASVPEQERNAKLLAEEILKLTSGTFNARQLGRTAGGPLRRAKAMAEACEVLTELNWIRPIDTNTRRKDFDIHPKIRQRRT